MAPREAEDVIGNAPMDNLPLVVQPLQTDAVFKGRQCLGDRSWSIHSFLSEEQLCKISQKRYVRKPKSDVSKDKVDLLGNPDMADIFSGSHERLEETAQQFYSSSPKIQHFRVGGFVIRKPHSRPSYPGTRKKC